MRPVPKRRSNTARWWFARATRRSWASPSPSRTQSPTTWAPRCSRCAAGPPPRRRASALGTGSLRSMDASCARARTRARRSRARGASCAWTLPGPGPARGPGPDPARIPHTLARTPPRPPPRQRPLCAPARPSPAPGPACSPCRTPWPGPRRPRRRPGARGTCACAVTAPACASWSAPPSSAGSRSSLRSPDRSRPPRGSGRAIGSCPQAGGRW
mmetsp:Transcript_13489/g.45694  ORF Transcript_13489/g.45694 Transcript_13489/m.45694 type:complete len:214 (-) Transcript_13489:160-801(-)